VTRRWGTVLNLFVFASWIAPTSAGAEETVTLTLHNGSNLVAFHVLPDDPAVDVVFGDLLDSTLRVMGEAVITVPLISGEWAGNLVELERTRGYWITLDLPDGVDDYELEVTGEPTDPDVRYVLHEGNNLVSFPCADPTALVDAIPEEFEGSFEGIIGEGVAAFYNDGRWIGSLSTLQPNHGYFLNLLDDVDDITFSFDCTGGDGADDYVYGCLNPAATNHDSDAVIDDRSCLFDVPDDWEYAPGWGQAFTLFNDVRIDDIAIAPNDAIGAFVGATCVGFGHPIGSWTTVPSLGVDADQVVVFRIYQADKELIFNLPTDPLISWVDNGLELGGCVDTLAANFSEDATVAIENCIECDEDGPCDDGNACTTDDSCVDNACVGATAVECDDDDECTSDGCDSVTGCVHVLLDTPECLGEDAAIGPDAGEITDITEDPDAFVESDGVESETGGDGVAGGQGAPSSACDCSVARRAQPSILVGLGLLLLAIRRART
jgi:hypothetical protein